MNYRDPHDEDALRVYQENLVLCHQTVKKHIQDNLEKTDPKVDFDVYIVWFCFILGGWKALVSSTLPDGRYYEATFNKITDEVYVDTYVKVNNTAYPVKNN